jgi:hypothetical protein
MATLRVRLRTGGDGTGIGLSRVGASANRLTPSSAPSGTRVVGSGPPLVLIMGYDWTMEGWDPRLVHALARHTGW